MTALLEKLKKSQCLLFDGAMGTMLQKMGLEAGHCPEDWNLSHPDAVRNIHEAYFAAGSDIVETNTFGGTIFKLKAYGLEKKVYQINRRAVELAREVAPNGCYVAGSVGPTGQFLKPYGEVSFKEMQRAFFEQMLGLRDGGADILCIETMSDLEEARAAISAAQEVSDLVIFAAMVFQKGPRGYRTLMGVDPTKAASELEAMGAHVVGSNCGNGMDEMIEIIKEMKEATDRFLLAKPNAGMPKFIEGQTLYDESPDGVASKVPALYENGARIIGACCGSTPEHIREMSLALKGL